MTSLDLRSFNFLAALQCAVMGAVLLGIRHNFPSNIKGLRYWGLAPLLALGATGFYALLGHAPALVVGLGGNGLLMASTVALLAGTREFLGQPWRWWPWVSLVLGCLAGLFVFFVIWLDYRPRMLIFGLGMAAICAAHTQVLARHGRGFAARLMLVAMAWQTLVLVTRALTTYWIDTPETQRFDAGSVIHMVFVATFSFTILMVLVSAQLMASERVRLEFEHLASHDDLTGTLNRRAILRLAAARPGPLQTHQRQPRSPGWRPHPGKGGWRNATRLAPARPGGSLRRRRVRGPAAHLRPGIGPPDGRAVAGAGGRPAGGHRHARLHGVHRRGAGAGRRCLLRCRGGPGRPGAVPGQGGWAQPGEPGLTVARAPPWRAGRRAQAADGSTKGTRPSTGWPGSV